VLAAGMARRLADLRLDDAQEVARAVVDLRHQQALTSSEQNLVLGENAIRVYKLID
jgi:hypothetical protein